MGIDRRDFLTGGLTCTGLALLPGKYPVAGFNSSDDLAAIFGLHPFTVSLLERVKPNKQSVLGNARSANKPSKARRCTTETRRRFGM
jgi:hypothetical protein